MPSAAYERSRGKKGLKRVSLPPPTAEYILQLRRDADRLYATQDEQIRVMRQVRELLDPQSSQLADWRVVDVEVRAPIATDNIQRTAATLSVNPPELQCIPESESEAISINATLREKTTESIFQEAGERDSGPPAYQMSIDAAVADGGAWTKLLLTDDVWDNVYRLTLDAKDEDGRDLFEDDDDPPPKPAEEPESYAKRVASKDTREKKYKKTRDEEKRKAGLPITWMQVDAATVYPFYGGAGKIREVLEVQVRPTASTFREYRLGRGTDGSIVKTTGRSRPVAEDFGEGGSRDAAEDQGTGADDVEFLEHWDDTYVTYMVCGNRTDGGVTGQIVDQWKHGYGRHPYFFAPGIWMNHWKNRKVGWGVSESMRWLVQYLGFLLTVHANLAARDAFVPLQEEQDDVAAPLLGNRDKPQATGAAEPEKWRLGVIYRQGPGRRLSPITFPQVAEQLKEQIKLVMDLIEQLVTPRVSSQIGGNMEGAGFAISQVLAEGRIRHDPIAQGIERMLKQLTEFLWHLIKDVLKEDVWVYAENGETAGWSTLGPDDLKNAVKIIWTVNAETPSAELLKARYWGERLQMETASRRQAVEGMGDNYDEVRLGRTIDRIQSHPAYLAWEEARVFAAADRGDILEKYAGSIAQNMVQSGEVPGAGPPGGNPASPPDIGALAMPGSGGATPAAIPGPMATTGGVSPGATNPGQAAQAQLQNLGPPGQ
jgi:hypothetical protein